MIILLSATRSSNSSIMVHLLHLLVNLQNDVLLIMVLFGVILGVKDIGSPAGLMADCPGMNRSTVLTEKTKRSLDVVLIYPSASVLGHSEGRCKLSAAGASCTVKRLNLTKRRTQVLISGYMDSSFSPMVRSLVSVYLARGRNVIVVELFPVLVRTYPLAARMTKPLGELLGEFLAGLTRQGLSPNRLELTGASLGAHIASYAADKYRHLTGCRPARLTALDPAGPCFRSLPPKDRLNSDAAYKVDVLHTNIDGFGIADPSGHVDFYANGGEFQQSMAGNFILPCFQLCSHVRAAIYWILAHDNPDKFVAVRCDSVADARLGNCYDKKIKSNVLGLKTNFSKPGVYYLPTSEVAPYFMGEAGLKKRKYGVNDYLLKAVSDEDITI